MSSKVPSYIIPFVLSEVWMSVKFISSYMCKSVRYIDIGLKDVPLLMVKH